jgi:glycosyltransferase involved in cell wall biosynthesis
MDESRPAVQEEPATVAGSIAELTRQANRFLVQDDLARAYPYVCRLAEQVRDGGQTSNTAGLMALSLGKRAEAERHFQRAVQQDASNRDAGYNLTLLAMGDGRWDDACAMLERLLKHHPDDAGLYNDLAVVRTNLDDFSGALHAYEKALERDPNFTKARRNAMQLVQKHRLFDYGKRLLEMNEKHQRLSEESKADIQRWRKTLSRASEENAPGVTDGKDASITVVPSDEKIKGKRIAFFASQATFVKDIITHLANDNDTRLFSGQSLSDMRRLMEWADLAWFEWCDQLVIEATKFPKQCAIVCRLHSYEAFTDMPRKVDWRKVDRLIFVNKSVQEIFERQVRTSTPATVIHNGVDLEKFTLCPDKKYGKKIASVGYINYKKNPALLLYCFKKIHAYDPEYTLHIAGQHQDPRIQVYFEHFLRENPLPVQFDGWVEDMPHWYADKDYIISTSLFESFHYSIAEGMACGVLPLIHNWYGAGYLYPKDYLFNDADECLALLQRLENVDKHQAARRNREYIAQRYDQADKFEEIARLLASVMKDVHEKSGK